MKILEKEKGSITLFVLIAMLFFAMFLVGMYILNANAEGTGIAETARIKEIYEQGVNNIDDVYETNKNELLTKVAKPGDYVKYIVPEKEFTMTTNQTGYNVAQTFKTSDYIGLWQILYNDKEHGLQIVSADDVTNGVTLYLATNGNYGTSKTAYNNLVSTLNNFCSNYVNETYAISGRCIGSNPNNPEGTKELFICSLSHATGFIKGDTDYEIDYNAMVAAKNQNSNGIQNIGKKYWLASRNSSFSNNHAYFHIRSVATTGSAGKITMCLLGPDNYTYSEADKEGIRAVITLKSQIRTITGNGSIESPFELNI